jgi:DNA-binding CsgD family transcriptional regulator
MVDPKLFSVLTDDIYGAILDESRWPDALRQTVQFVGAQAGLLLWWNETGGASHPVCWSVGVEPCYAESYAEHYATLDPLRVAMLSREIGDVASATELVPRSEFLESRFYKEWAQPQGWAQSVQANLDKSRTSFVYLSLWRNRTSGSADWPTKDRLRLLASHLRRAMLVRQIVDRHTAEAARLGDTLDGIGPGLFFVNADAQILESNANGRAMLEQGTLVRAQAGRLVLADRDASRGLTEILCRFQSGTAASDVRPASVLVSAHAGEPFVAHVAPLVEGMRRSTGGAYTAVAAVFVQKASFELPSSAEIIARTYKLTPAELRVLLAIVEVGGVPKVSETMGISLSTVRTHLRRLFAKTRTERQADLVKLVAAYANPLFMSSAPPLSALPSSAQVEGLDRDAIASSGNRSEVAVQE